MKLSEQVVSLEIAKRLKELGVEIDSLFWWNHFKSYAPKFEPTWAISDYLESDIKHSVVEVGISAPTASELAEMLPECYPVWKYKNNYYCDRLNQDDELDDDGDITRSKTMANALGKMLIYLKENKLMEVS
jgi:hypothetical protein